jgi:hypothetical protein
MSFVKTTLSNDFVIPLKTNRKVALSLSTKKNGQYQKVETMNPEPMQPVYLEKVHFSHLIIKRVFINEDVSTEIMYLWQSILHCLATESP